MDYELPEDFGPVLENLPEEVRTQATEILGKYHKDYTEIQKKYDQWKAFDGKVDPAMVEQSLNFYSLVDQNPQLVYEKLQEYLTKQGKLPAQTAPTKTQDSDVDDDGIPSDLANNPEFKRIQQQLQQMQDAFLQQQEAEKRAQEAAAEDARLEKALQDLKKKHGEFDDREILMRMAQYGMSPDEAYDDYAKFVEKISGKKPVPKFLGPGGVVPTPNIDPKKLTPQQARELAVQAFEQARRS